MRRCAVKHVELVFAHLAQVLHPLVDDYETRAAGELAAAFVRYADAVTQKRIEQHFAFGRIEHDSIHRC
jgi:hypothetical protein